jgi:hypothetical protein
VLPANWRAGLADAREAGVFVSPPVAGFVFACGADVAALADVEGEIAPRLERLAARFGIAAWFRSDDARDAYGWALAREGSLARAYAFDGERGPSTWLGEVDEAERALGCHVDDPRDHSDDDVKWWPDRRIVHAIAAAWSIDPDQLTVGGRAHGAGLVGRMGPLPTA